MKEKWRIKVPKWYNIPIESATLILEEGKNYLSYTITEADKITAKSFAFILLLISAIGAIIGVTNSELNSRIINKAFICFNMIYVFIIFFLVLFFVKIHFPRLFMMQGRKPDEIANKEMLAPKNLPNEHIHLSLVLHEIENCKAKIDFNYNQNIKRIKLLKIGTILSCFMFLVYFIVMLIIKIEFL